VALGGATGVAVVADGMGVYVVAYDDNAVNHFSRAADGSLSFQSCIDETAGGECSTPAGVSLVNARFLTATDDGRSVYVSSETSDSISHFSRGAGGSLSFESCIDDLAGGDCVTPLMIAMNSPLGLVATDDGRSVYAAAGISSSLVHFDRAADGDLDFRRCFDEMPGGDCVTPAGVSLGSSFHMAASPEGRSVYALGLGDNAVNHFSRELPRCRGLIVTAFGRNGADAIRGTPGRDVIAGFGGNDRILGRGGNDLICGGRDPDRLVGGAGKDTLAGQAGRDKLRGGPGRDTLIGGAGLDRLVGGPKRDRCRGGPGLDLQLGC
jgi:Ca2+-binding RTX toxin-like protein